MKNLLLAITIILCIYVNVFGQEPLYKRVPLQQITTSEQSLLKELIDDTPKYVVSSIVARFNPSALTSTKISVPLPFEDAIFNTKPIVRKFSWNEPNGKYRYQYTYDWIDGNNQMNLYKADIMNSPCGFLWYNKRWYVITFYENDIVIWDMAKQDPAP